MRALIRPILRAGWRGARDDGGSAAVLGALLLSVLLWCGAFAVDLGSLYFERRTAQGAVDLAAIAAARDIDSAQAAAHASLEANGIRYITGVTVTPGHYAADPAIAPEARFTADAEPHNAVEVTLRQEAPLHLAGAVAGMKSMTLTTRAVAAATEQAAFSIGSRLARLEGGVANAMLEALLGGSLDLTVMDYRALADADIKLFDFMDALATELDVTGASYSETLDAEATLGQVAAAMAAAASEAGRSDAAQALLALGSSPAAAATVPLAAMLDLGPYGELETGSPAPGLDASVNAMGMLSMAAAAANGDNQVSLGLGAAVPGLANVEVDVAIGERAQDSPWLTVGERGASVRTAQTRLRIVATVGGMAGLNVISVRLPLYVEIAQAEGRLRDITCGAEPARDASVEVAAKPGVTELWLGEIDRRRLDNFSAPLDVEPARLLDTPLARVSGEAHAAMTNVHDTILHFDRRDIDEQIAQSTATADPLATLLDSLIRDLDIEVRVAGQPLVLPGVLKSAVAGLVSAAAPALDRLLGAVLDTLGLSIGEADITVRGVRCDGAALVG